MKLRKLVFTSLFAALTCVATMIIRIPSGMGGYVNMGDALVLLSGYILGPVYGGIAAGLGSCLADVFSGYLVYAVPTFVIKFLAALCAGFLFKKYFNKNKFLMILFGLIGELIVVAGYFVTEIFLYGSIAAGALGILGNTIQGAFGVVASMVLFMFISRIKKN